MSRSTPTTAADRRRSPARAAARPAPAAPVAAPSSLEQRLGRVLQWFEQCTAPPAEPDWAALAFTWRRQRVLGTDRALLAAVHRIAHIAPEDLLGVEAQKQALLRNTAQFVRRLPANNVLLAGSRGTGKSSLVRACLARFGAQGLRLIEVEPAGLVDLPLIAERVAARPERFVLFCDDLSFEPTDASYKALKAMLDGSVAAGADNLLIYATSNRRHLMPEAMRENLEARYDADGELHPGETSEEKISLSERFGICLTFHSFRQDDYLEIVAHWLARYGLDGESIGAARDEALRFAMLRGSRSGRVAAQFARDYAGRLALGAS